MSASFGYEVIVLGGGKGGKTLASELGNKGVRTALIERSDVMIGGSCINVACIPTKTLIASARAAHAARQAPVFGVQCGAVTIDWPAVRRRAERVVSAMREMNHKNLTSSPALDLILGTGRFIDHDTLEVREKNGNLRYLTAKRIFINTGTRPAQPGLPGLDAVGALTSESIQRLDELPRHLLIIGGGYIAVEFAQMFRRFGCSVTVVERAAQLLRREDRDVATTLAEVLRQEGVDLLLNCAIDRLERADGAVKVFATADGKAIQLEGSHVLAALGRTPNTDELNLQAAGVEVDGRGFVKVNERLETTAPGVWALGDVNGGPQFTHASLDDYRIVKANVFEGGARSTRDRLMPFTLFTEPELARIGLTEAEARKQGYEIRVAKLPVAAIPRAKTMSEGRGFIKAVVDARTQRILGCSILSIEAGEMLGAIHLTMAAGLPYTALRDAALSHPTMVEGFNNLFAGF